MSPNITEILHGIGAFDRVVAVSNYCQYPPEVKNLPRVGSWIDSSLEGVLALRPDLVIMSDAQAAFSDAHLRKLGLRTLVVQAQSLEDALSAIVIVGRAVGNEKQAESLASRTRSELEEIEKKCAGLKRPRVLCIVDRMPGTLRDLYAASPGSFLAELVQIAGGEPLSPGGMRYSKITKEAVLTFDPEVIIDMVQGAQGNFSEKPEAVWGELPTVSAVRAKRIHPIRDVGALHASQFVSVTARKFARIIHPEVFGHDTER
jgi:iron complex transport system substrate-binding protein